MQTSTHKNTSSPDYRCPAYIEMMQDWTLCQDVKAGTKRMREKKSEYLPRFENEDPKDYEARIKMTFANDHYDQTLTDHVGLVFAKMPELAEDVSDTVKDLLENVDGEGTHWQVFAQDSLDTALDYGHGVIFTDYPDVGPDRPTLGQAQRGGLRPYMTFYSAENIPNWRITTVGGVKRITQITLKEDFEAEDGGFGVDCRAQYRVLRQEVVRDEFGTAKSLGKMTWQLYRDTKGPDGKSALLPVGEGEIRGPAQLPVRVVYGGKRIGILHTRPHLLQMAYTNLQETQVESDYATIMHKCNVPTPVFKGRPQQQQTEPIAMGYGIDVPANGDAFMLEPSGAALGATRTRLEDLRGQMRRQGAFMHEATNAMTAEEAALYARQRNARLLRAARSLQDALEGALMDFVAYLPKESIKSGSVTVNMDFGMKYDTAFADLCLRAYEKGALDLPAVLHVLQTGKLPDDMDVEEMAIKLMAEAEERERKALEMQNDPQNQPQDEKPSPNEE
jgi:hypothetical protein